MYVCLLQTRQGWEEKCVRTMGSRLEAHRGRFKEKGPSSKPEGPRVRDGVLWERAGSHLRVPGDGCKLPER